MNVLTKIEQANYVASTGDVQSLARLIANGVKAHGMYLKVLVATAQHMLGKPNKRTKVTDHTEVVNSAHESLYAEVLKGVAEEDPSLSLAQLQKAGTFARSAAHYLRGYAQRGGDVRALDAATVTKRALMPPREAPKPEELIPNATAHLESLIEKLDPEEQKSALKMAIHELQEKLAALEPAAAPRYPATQRAQGRAQAAAA